MLELERFCYGPLGTFGRLSGFGFEGYTVERPWAGNAPFTSCIPEGVYTCRWVDSPKFGRTIEVTGVPQRTHILFHVANTMDDLEGCIGVGENLGALAGKWSVMASRNALHRLHSLLREVTEWQLRIFHYVPEYP